MTDPILIRPIQLRGEPCHEVYECDQVRPAFQSRRQAIDYAIQRCADFAKAIEVRDASGAVIRRLEAQDAKALAHRRNFAG